MVQRTPSVEYSRHVGGPEWRIVTATVDLRLGFDIGGVTLNAFSMGDTASGLPLIPHHPVSYFTVAGKRSAERTWTFDSWSRNDDEQSVSLEIDSTVLVDDSALRVTSTIWLSRDLPVIRLWSSVRNESETQIEINRHHLIDLALDFDLAEMPLELFSVDAFAGHRKDTWEPGDANFAVREEILLPGDAIWFSAGAYQERCSWLAVGHEEAGLVVGLEYDGASEFRIYDAARTAGATVWGNQESAMRGVRLIAAPIGDLHVRLSLGEMWRSPAAFVARFEDGWDGAAAVTHALVEQHLAPPLPDDDFPYVMFNSWGYAFDLDPGNLLRCLDLAAEIGVEVFVADYGWARDVGDWVSVGDRIPPLPELRELVQARGMKLGAWMGFANAGPNTPVLTEHPEWRADPNDWGSFKSHALCLAEPVVREWVTAEMIRVVAEYGLDYLVHDFELITPCTHPDHHHPPDPSGYHSATAYNEVLRQVRAAHPSLVIENCQGGGRIMTYAMVQLHDTSIASDGPVLRDALSRRQALYGASYPFPLRYCDNYMEERPTDLACHTSMIGGPWILMDQMTAWTEDDIASARRNIPLYKRIRSRFRDARIFHLRRPDGAEWDGLQIHQPETDNGIIYLFQPAAATSDQVELTLGGLIADRIYRLTSGVSNETWTATGESLMSGESSRTLAPGTSEVILVD